MLKHNHHFSNLICQLTLIDTKRGWKGGEWTKVLKGSTEVLEFGINCHKIELDLILAAYLKNFQRNFRARGSHEDTSNPERDPCITWMYFHQLSAAISRGLPTHDFKHHNLASLSSWRKWVMPFEASPSDPFSHLPVITTESFIREADRDSRMWRLDPDSSRLYWRYRTLNCVRWSTILSASIEPWTLMALFPTRRACLGIWTSWIAARFLRALILKGNHSFWFLFRVTVSGVQCRLLLETAVLNVWSCWSYATFRPELGLTRHQPLHNFRNVPR